MRSLLLWLRSTAGLADAFIGQEDRVQPSILTAEFGILLIRSTEQSNIFSASHSNLTLDIEPVAAESFREMNIKLQSSFIQFEI